MFAFSCFSVKTAPMMPKSTRQWLFAGSLSVFSLVASAPIGVSQTSFYGSPPPSDYATNEGHNETGSIRGDSSPGLLGLGEGIFSRSPFQFTAAVREGYDSNLFTTKNDVSSSFYTNWAAGANYSFGGPRLQLGASLGGGITYYYTRPGDKVDYNGSFSLNANYAATSRLNLSINTTTAYLAQPDVTIVGGTNRENGDYLYSNTTLQGAYQWTQIFSTVTSYNITPFYYIDDNLNSNQGRIEQTIGQSFRWLWKPKTTLVAEYRFNPITYYDVDLNQMGNYFLLGFDQVFNPRFTWNVRGGAQVNFNQNPTDGASTYVGPFMESILNYQFLPASKLSWNMRYGTEASGLNYVTQRQTFRTGLYVSHAFTPRISATLGFNYQNNYYDQSNVISSFTENIFDLATGVTFKINRLVSLQAGYQFTVDLAPDQEDREYTRNIVFAGANCSF